MKEKLTSLWQKLFGDSVRAFGVVSLIFLASLAIAPAKNFFSEWRHYQHGYLQHDPQPQRRQSRCNATSRAASSRSGCPNSGVVDRCTSCHVGLKEASLADVPTQPFRTHPVIPHKLDQFGCTICHRGQGAATTVAEAHNSTLALGAADSAGEVHRILVRPMPPRAAAWHAATESGPQPALSRRLRALPHW